jgi:hypothetical protein
MDLALCARPQITDAVRRNQTLGERGVILCRLGRAQARPLLGAAFLAITGGEALYADMGHRLRGGPGSCATA